MRGRACVAVACVLIAISGCSPAAPTAEQAPTAAISGTLTRKPAPTPTTAIAPDQPAATVDKVEWGVCADHRDEARDDDRFECATVTVPVDHTDIAGPTLDLALIRLPAPAGANRIGSLLINPGGPGASGVEWVRFGAVDAIPAELRARFDIVGFDPRGVGGSSAISCGEVSPIPDVGRLDPDSATIRDAITAQARLFVEACEADSGGLLPFVSTQDAARDLDLIRQAVGDEKLTYLGYSYGTYLGTTYAELFGDNVRALVLDGAIDPSLDLIGRAEGSSLALERTLEAFVEECTHDRRCALHERLRDGFTVDGFLEQLVEQPVPAASVGPDRTLDDGAARLAMLALLRDRRLGWPLLDEGLHMAADGDGSLLVAIADGAVGRGQSRVDDLAANLAVTCTDLPQPDMEELFAAAEEIRAVAPRFGPSYLMMYASCAVWPATATQQPAPAAATDAPRLLVVGTTGDPVTPFAWSEALADQLGARLLTRSGSQHTAFGGENACTDRAVIPYLIDLVLPPEGWSCG